MAYYLVPWAEEPFPGQDPDFDQQHADTLCMLHPGGGGGVLDPKMGT